jgi:hypothetical protein
VGFTSHVWTALLWHSRIPPARRDAQAMDLSFQSVSGVFAGYVIDLLLLARTTGAQRLSTVILNSFADDTVARKHRRVRAIPS